MFRLSVKLVVALLYLAASVAVIGIVAQRVVSFDGIIVIEGEHAEHWVVRSSETGGIFSAARHPLPAELIGFDNPRTAVKILGNGEAYEAEPLPFSLHLKRVEIVEEYPKKDVLEITCAEQQVVRDAYAGLTVEMPGGRIAVTAVEPWTGLVRDGRGAPMAMVALQQDDKSWQPPLFVAEGERIHPMPEVMILLRCHKDETSAREAASQKKMSTLGMRWGIREDRRIHWFDSLVPGTGLTTAEGTEYTLADTVTSGQKQPISIRVFKKNARETSTEVVEANSQSRDGDILFEQYVNNVVFILHSWRDGAVLVVTYISGNRTRDILLNEDDSLSVKLPDGSTLRLRLAQMMLKAIPIPNFNDGVMALVLETPDGALRLREGMSRPVREARVSYRRRPRAPLVRYTLEAVFGKEKPAHEFILAPGGRYRIEDWRFYHDQENTEAGTIAILRAKYSPGTIGQYAALVFLIVCAAALLVIRFGIRRFTPNTAVEFDDETAWTAVTSPMPVGDHDRPALPPESNDPAERTGTTPNAQEP